MRPRGVFWLTAIGFNQIEMDLRAYVAVSRSAGGQKKQGVFLLHRIFVIDLAKQLACIAELRFEFLDHLITHCIAALMNSVTNGCA